jgi:hypothetical protein
MPSNLYLCKYCHQRKPTETALNRHIAHSPICFRSWQDDLRRLSLSENDLESNVNHRTLAMVDWMPADSLVDDNVEVLIPEVAVPAPKKKNISIHHSSEERDEREDIDNPRLQTRYRRRYPEPAKILGEGKTSFETWKEEQDLHGGHEWAPFTNQKEWDLVQWLIKNVGKGSIDEYLKLPIVSICTNIPSRNTNLSSDSRACRVILP